MSRSKLTIRRVAPPEHQVTTAPVPPAAAQDDGEMMLPQEVPEVPAHWQKGQLLNVRNAGHCYVVTLYPEEDDWRHPERTMRFQNPARVQDFVSQWYARESHDPRAY